MALTWDLSKVKQHEELWIDAGKDSEGEQTYKLDAVTETMVFMSLHTGIGTITENNAPEVLRRLNVLEEVFGALMGNDKGPLYFTEEDVQRRIGLKTNAAFKDQSRSVFTRRMNKIREEKKRDSARIEDEKKEGITS